MKFLLLFISLISVSAMRWGQPEINGVVQLNQANFDAFITAHPFVVVKFSSDFCMPCRRSAPVFAKLAQAMNSVAEGVPLAEIDIVENPHLADRFLINAIPRFYIFEAHIGKERSIEDTWEWINARLPVNLRARIPNDEADLEQNKIFVKKILLKGLTNKDYEAQKKNIGEQIN